MDREDFDIVSSMRKTFVKFIPFWPLYALFILIGTSMAWVYLKMRVPVFRSTATLIIKDEKKGLAESETLKSLDPLSSKKIIENEIEVIKSRTIMHKTVMQLGLYAELYRKEFWKRVSIYDDAPLRVEVKTPDEVVEVADLPLRYEPTKLLVRMGEKNYSLDEWHKTPFGSIRFSLTSERISQPMEIFVSLKRPKRVARELSKRLEVNPFGKLSSVITLSLTDSKPKRAEDVLNAVISQYIEVEADDKDSLALNTLAFLDKRLEVVSSELHDIESRLEAYRTSKGGIDVSSRGRVFLETMTDNDQKLSDINMKYSVLEQIEQYLSSKENTSRLVPATIGVDDPLISELLSQLYALELQYDKLYRTTGQNNPELVSLRDQINSIKPRILENVITRKKALLTAQKNVSQRINNYSSKLRELPEQERDILEITRQQSIKSAIYNFILQKREEAALSSTSKISASKIVDKADSTFEPVDLSETLIISLAALSGLCVGLIIISIKEALAGKVLYHEDIESATSFPVICSIVDSQSRKPVVLDNRKTFIAENFRQLRTSLNTIHLGSPKKVLVTSTVSGEGKSFVAINLAMSVAITGKKVVLVDFDLHNPSIESKLGLRGKLGVCDYLLGGAEIDEVIAKSSYDNLYVLTAGTLQANPSELLLGARTEKLLLDLAEKFDFVVVDSPPVAFISDAYILSRFCDATFYIVRHRYTRKVMLERLQKNNEINELKNLALIYNGTAVRSSSYGYYYRYGYSHNKHNASNSYHQRERLHS